MIATKSLEGSPDTLHRLGSLSVVSFALATFAFYVSLVRAGYEPGLAVLACTSAGIAFLLLRVQQRVAEEPEALLLATDMLVLPRVGETLLAQGELLILVDSLLREARSAKGEVGLMLISAQTPDGPGSLADSGVINLVRGRLFRDADSKVFQLDDKTLAIAERRPDVAAHMEHLSAALHEEVRSRSRAAQGFTPAQVIVGVATTANPKASVADLFTTARSATRLADAAGRDSYFRHL